jgi:hypothetical protein
MIEIENVQNPLTEITSKNIFVKTYDGLNLKIIDRSYRNLNPNRMAYKYPGPLIIINSKQIAITHEGRLSKPIPITFDYPCALNMTLVPTSANFIFEPYHIETYVGMMETSF